MNKVIVICAVFAFADCLKLENFKLSEIASNIQGYRLNEYLNLKPILEELIKKLEGHKVINIPLVEIDENNRAENINLESNIPGIHLDAVGDNRRLNIKNLTVPVSLFKVTGEYNLEGISLFDLLIYGKGDFIINFSQLNIFLSINLDYKSSRGWNVTDIKLDTSVGNSLIKLENLMNGEPMGEFLNFMVDELFKVAIDLLNGLVEQYKKQILEVLTTLINKLLDDE